MRHPIRLLGPLAALALGACGGGGGDRGGTMPPPPTGNTVPTLSGLSMSQSLLQDSVSNPLAFEIGDAETAVDQLEVTASSSNAELLPGAGILLSGSGSHRTLMLQPEAGQAGSTDVTITVKDAEGATSTQKLALQVTAEEKSFREFALAQIDASPDAKPAETAGASWIDTEENDPAAFDSALSAVAE